MDYRKCAEELMRYVLMSEERIYFVEKNMRELAHGESAVLLYLMEENDGANAKELSERFAVNTSRIAAILNGLVKKGYIIRQKDADDKRMVRVFITEKGRIFTERRKDKLLDYCAAMLERLGEEESELYVNIMKHICEIFQKIKEEGITGPDEDKN